MKKIVLGVVVIMFLAGSTVYAGKYADIKPVIEEMATTFEKFVTGMEKAENADAVAAAFDYHAKAMTALAPKMKEILKKYPELKDDKTHPEELKPLLTKMDELTKKLTGLMMGKFGQYANDPKVKEAMERWQKAAAAMEGEDKKDEEEKEE